MGEKTYTCPDCTREGNADQLGPGDFWYYHATRYTEQLRRSAYCKRHDRIRASKRQRDRLDPQSPTYDSEYHERVKQQKRDWAARHRK